jgi:hypothetical protein
VANAILYENVANVAAIPGSPANNKAVEVVDSTGIESFTPLSGKPSGFTGSSGLSVRIVYTTTGSTWNWIQYFPNDPETRYLKFSGGTLTGQLRADDSTSVAAPVYAFDGDSDTGIAHTGANELALVTGGTPRLTFDSSGNATFANSVTIPAGSTVSGYLDATTAASTYLTQSNASSTYLTQSNASSIYQTQSGMSSYLTTASAGSTYQPLSGMSSYLTTSNAASTYQTISGMSSYLTTSAAGTTYAPLASPTFTGTVTIPAGASIDGYLTSATAASTYQTQAGMSNYLPTSSVGTSVQPYNANTALLNVAQTFSALQTFNSGASDSSGSFRVVPANSQASAYTPVSSDTGKYISISSGGVTIPASIFNSGAVFSIYNNSGSSQTITQGSGVTLRQAGTTNTGNRSLAAYGIATVLCVGANTFVITGVGLS